MMGYGGRYTRDSSRDAEATRLLHLAFDLGITFFDTAEVYGAGHSEELLGHAFADRRDTVVLATKFSSNNSSASAVKAACDASLRRLRSDYIDLYQFHWPNCRVPVSETLEALAELVQAGKVRAVGLGNATTADIRNAVACAPAGMPLVSVQEEYNLGERFVEDAVLPFCRQRHMALIAYSPLGQGRLLAAADARQGILSGIASAYGVTPAQAALQWIARQDGVIAIPMTQQEKNLRANAAALLTPIAPADLDRITCAFRADILRIPTEAIEVVASHTGKIFRSLDEARANTLGLSPSPVELSLELMGGEMLKPVKVRPKNSGSGKFELFEGQLRYWAWIIAHHGARPIPAVVVAEDAVERRMIPSAN
jgi:aryl-alcohol dehydrogenase-like predicted oxidoreductase